ncbi:hypothetical protein Trydic_g10945 [Trypoxylus dichotomus]
MSEQPDQTPESVIQDDIMKKEMDLLKREMELLKRKNTLLCRESKTEKNGFKEKALIQYVIDGISDAETNKAILHGAETITKLKKQPELYAIMKSKTARTEGRHERHVKHLREMLDPVLAR